MRILRQVEAGRPVVEAAQNEIEWFKTWRTISGEKEGRLGNSSVRGHALRCMRTGPTLIADPRLYRD